MNGCSPPGACRQDGHYAVRSDDGTTDYRFAARRQALDHWQIDADSITRHRDDAELPLDALAFFLELRDALGLGEAILPVYLEEISSTLSGTAYKLAAEAAHRRRARAAPASRPSRPA